MKARLAVFATFLVLALPLGAGAAHRYQALIDAAHEFDRAAEHFHGVIDDLAGYSHLAGDVHQLAEEAHRFHRSVERGADLHGVRGDFEHLKGEFSHTEVAYRRAHDVHHQRHVERDWEKVRSSFSRLDREVSRLGHEQVVVDPWPDYRNQLIGVCDGWIDAQQATHRAMLQNNEYARHAREVEGLLNESRRFADALRGAANQDAAIQALGRLEEAYKKVRWEVEDVYGLGADREVQGYWRNVAKGYDRLLGQVRDRPERGGDRVTRPSEGETEVEHH